MQSILDAVEVYLEIQGTHFGFIRIMDADFIDTLLLLDDGRGLCLHIFN